MQKQRYRWWRFIRRVIRAYPALKKEYEELRRQSITVELSGMPKGSGTARSTENLALQTLPPDDQKDYDAVAQAIELTRRRNGGDLKIELIRYVYWYEKEHTVSHAAPVIGISEATAKRWHGEFIKLVARCWGFHI